MGMIQRQQNPGLRGGTYHTNYHRQPVGTHRQHRDEIVGEKKRLQYD
jgi:hypothetical protein